LVLGCRNVSETLDLRIARIEYVGSRQARCDCDSWGLNAEPHLIWQGGYSRLRSETDGAAPLVDMEEKRSN
jgi:hypothetical protein